MSIKASEQVWLGSQQGGTELLLLLAIADHANDAGYAYPSVARLAEWCRATPRHANRLLAELRDSGELEIRLNAGPRGKNLYRIRFEAMKPRQPLTPTSSLTGMSPLTTPSPLTGSSPLTATSSTPDIHVPETLTHMSAEPSLNRQDPSERDARASRSRCADRGSRLAADWKLPPEWKAWAQDKRPELNADLCAETFADYWHAKPGKDALKADWFSTWRNWVRKERGAAGTQSRMPSATGQPKTFSSVDYSEAA